jgi:hypothetical protein
MSYHDVPLLEGINAMQVLFIVLLIAAFAGFAAFLILLDAHFTAAKNESVSGFRRKPSKWIVLCVVGNIALNIVLILVLTSIWRAPPVEVAVFPSWTVNADG